MGDTALAHPPVAAVASCLGRQRPLPCRPRPGPASSRPDRPDHGGTNAPVRRPITSRSPAASWPALGPHPPRAADATGAAREEADERDRRAVDCSWARAPGWL